MISVSRSVGRPASRSVLSGQSNDLTSIIKKLFTNNEQGFFYDPNDLSTMFQDAAGNVPVTDVGQPVGLIRDKSGRNNHAFQANSASRPILRKNALTGAYYLEFDGSDDFLQTANIDFTSTDKVSLFAGVRKLSDAALGMLVELSVGSGINNGAFRIGAPASSGQNYSFFNKGSIERGVIATGFASPISNVLSANGNISADMTRIKLNGALPLSNNLDLGTGNYGSYPLFIGRRAGTTFPFNGHIYGLIGIGKLTSDNETTAIENELAKRVGVTLSV